MLRTVGFIFCIMGMNISHGQLTVDPNVSATDLVNTIAGYGVVTQNVQLNCPNGAFGTFDATSSNVGIDDGVLLTTGYANTTPGCTYSFYVGDSGNDGWNCNALYLYIDGVQYGPYTDTTTWGTTSYQVVVEDGVSLAIEYINDGTPGCDSSQHWYELYDGTFTLVSAGGNNPFGSSLGQIPSGTTSLGTTNCGGNTLYGAGGPNDANVAGLSWYTVHNDPDLMQLEPTATNDVCMLEFDLIPACDTLEINYVFASEEYLDYVCSGLNDAFGFFISGPGISGPFSNGGVNMATVPGTGDFVGVNTVNNGNSSSGGPCTTVLGDLCPCNAAYYIDNGEGNDCPGPGHCSDATIMRYDGKTVPMSGKVAVTPCETYHLKLIIADAGDWTLDSGVFFSSEGLNCPSPTANLALNTQDTIVEGCTPGEIELTRLGSFNDTTEVTFQITGGTAVDVVDYNGIPGSLSFLPGDTVITLDVHGVLDGLAEGNETVEVQISYDVCGSIPLYDTVGLVIIECVALPIEISDFEVICSDDRTSAIVQWQTASELNCDYYSIEGSRDGTDFTLIATIDGSGSTENLSNYQWVDDAQTGIVKYYRLSQTDYDGKTEVIGVRSVDCEMKEGFEIFPIPFTDEFVINSKEEGIIILFDIAGKRSWKNLCYPGKLQLVLWNLLLEVTWQNSHRLIPRKIYQ